MPTVELGQDKNVLADKSVLLDAGSGFEYYSWSNNATTQTINVDSTGIGIGSKAFWVMVTNYNGCTAYDNIIVTFSKTIGINDNAEKAAILIYPNPSYGKITLEFSKLENETVNITVLNPQGQTVFDQNSLIVGKNASQQIDLSNLSTGMYFIRLSYKNQTTTEKIILK